MAALTGLVRRLVIGYQKTLLANSGSSTVPSQISISQFSSNVPVNVVPIRQQTPIIVKPVIRLNNPIIEQKASENTPSSKAALMEKYGGIEIPKMGVSGSPNFQQAATQQMAMQVNLTYPLIPKKPAKGEKILAYARIFWDPKQNHHLYQVIEPQLSDSLKEVLLKIKDLLEQRLDIEFNQLRKFEALDFLQNQVEDIIGYYRLTMSDDDKKILQYYIERDFIGLGKIEPLLRDDQIEDISCDGLDIPIFVFHRNSILGSVMTNVVFHDNDELDSFVMRLSQIAGKSISVATPLLNGSLPDGSRVQAMLATDIARRGSNFTIRKFTEEPLTPIHLLNYGTIDVKTLAYLWLMLDYGKSILISGGTASGKTTLLNVLSLFIRPDKKIVSIEDTPELKLPHPHWVPSVARTAISVSENKKIGEIDLFDLLRESLRQRPDYIIVGEVRGKEAYVLFQEMATGHPSMATIHAENMQKLLDRLTTPPIELSPGLIESANVIVFLLATRYKNRQTRRVGEILETVGLDENRGLPVTNQVFKWNPFADTFDVENKSVMLKQIADASGMGEQDIIAELKRRMAVLEWMRFRNIVNYRDVNSIINMYYAFPDRVIASIYASMPGVRK